MLCTFYILDNFDRIHSSGGVEGLVVVNFGINHGVALVKEVPVLLNSGDRIRTASSQCNIYCGCC